jgi:hypothetical protein
MRALKAAGKASFVVLIIVVAAVVTSRWWTAVIARSLVCAEQIERSDALLVENFDPTYLLFERAEALEKAGAARTTLIPVEAADTDVANPVSRGIAEVMARQARLRVWRVIPIGYTEPIALNASIQIRRQLIRDGIKSIIVIAPGFRSRRSSLVYRATLGDAGITVNCVPVFSRSSPERWTHSWHGIQEVIEEFVKLQYYRLYVLPFVAPHIARR